MGNNLCGLDRAITQVIKLKYLLILVNLWERTYDEVHLGISGHIQQEIPFIVKVVQILWQIIDFRVASEYSLQFNLFTLNSSQTTCLNSSSLIWLFVPDTYFPFVFFTAFHQRSCWIQTQHRHSEPTRPSIWPDCAWSRPAVAVQTT